MTRKFPTHIQQESIDCGPTCIHLIAKYYGKEISISYLKSKKQLTREGISLHHLSELARSVGFETTGLFIDFHTLKKEVPLPCILHWNNNHYAVLYKIKRGKFYISDPAIGRLKYSENELAVPWKNGKSKGIALCIEPSSDFNTESLNRQKNYNLWFIAKYLRCFKPALLLLLMSMIIISGIQLILPFLTQSIVDRGIKNSDIKIIYLILSAQALLFIGKSSSDIVRSWTLLHISTRLNITIISDFLIKLMKLPIAYFDSRKTGDILQRINDHKRIERILTSSSLEAFFSFTNLLVFGIILVNYNLVIFLIFLVGSLGYLMWISIFLKRRKQIDYKMFSQLSSEQSGLVELISGMQEIKLHNSEKIKRWSWERLQINIYRISIKSLTLEQIQSAGSAFINELKNIAISGYAAVLVVESEITLGMMLAISYIVGQMNGPILSFVSFIRDFQDAQISLERLGEIHGRADEDDLDEKKDDNKFVSGNLILKNLSFCYPQTENPTLRNISCTLPLNKTTAIVGTSGSGKTTLLKLLLKFYEATEGNIYLGQIDLNNISQKKWRSECGAVMQEGYIFNDTIARNIAVGEEIIDTEKLAESLKVAQLDKLIQELPKTHDTKIGMEGLNLSTGQKQRILIARAVYKNPSYLFFDEATSSLDTENEMKIVQGLKKYFANKTVVIIAHRLSTVKNADQILVLDKGKIVEIGNHQQLLCLKGHYFRLISNQL